MSGPSRPRGWARIPPPLLFALPFIGGLLLHRWLPLAHPSEALAGFLRWIGAALILIGAGHTLSSVAIFARSGTTVIPHHRSSVLVTRGAYHWTRNPMYVGMALIYLGLSVALGAVWPVLFLPFPLLVLDRTVIPMEERQLEKTFGPAYAAYRGRVRRWI